MWWYYVPPQLTLDGGQRYRLGILCRENQLIPKLPLRTSTEHHSKHNNNNNTHCSMLLPWTHLPSVLPWRVGVNVRGYEASPWASISSEAGPDNPQPSTRAYMYKQTSNTVLTVHSIHVLNFPSCNCYTMQSYSVFTCRQMA